MPPGGGGIVKVRINWYKNLLYICLNYEVSTYVLYYSFNDTYL
jgi:hypothetical protein